jgi:transposase
MTSKAKRAQYTLEFKLEAVRLVKAGQSMAAVAAALGVVEQMLYNWVKADREGKLAGAGAKPVTSEQMELARLRAEVARLKMERDILKNIRRGAPLPKGQKLRAKVYTGNAEGSGRPLIGD